jgi:hypothetical protein
MLLSRVYVMKFEMCQESFMLLSRIYVIKFEVCQLHKHVTAQNTPETPQTSLHKHGTPQNTPDIPQTSLHKHWKSNEV